MRDSFLRAFGSRLAFGLWAVLLIFGLPGTYSDGAWWWGVIGVDLDALPYVITALGLGGIALGLRVHFRPAPQPPQTESQVAAKLILKDAGFWPPWWKFWGRNKGLTESQYLGEVAKRRKWLSDVRHLIGDLQLAVDRFRLYKPLPSGYGERWRNVSADFGTEPAWHDAFHSTTRAFNLILAADLSMAEPEGADSFELDGATAAANDAIDDLDALARNIELELG